MADALSRLDITSNEPYKQMSFQDMCELYAADEEDFPAEYPLSYAEIAHEQDKDRDIQKVRTQKPERYVTEQRMFAGKSFQLVTREGKIVLPKSLTKGPWNGTTINYAIQVRHERNSLWDSTTAGKACAIL